MEADKSAPLFRLLRARACVCVGDVIAVCVSLHLILRVWLHIKSVCFGGSDTELPAFFQNLKTRALTHSWSIYLTWSRGSQ